MGSFNLSPAPFPPKALYWTWKEQRRYRETRMPDLCTLLISQAPLPSHAQNSLSSSTLCVGHSREGEGHELEHGRKMSARSGGPQIWLWTPGLSGCGPKRPYTKGNSSGRRFLTCILIASYQGMGQLRPSIEINYKPKRLFALRYQCTMGIFRLVVPHKAAD